jgi:P pilus assembly chaperone PapD
MVKLCSTLLAFLWLGAGVASLPGQTQPPPIAGSAPNPAGAGLSVWPQRLVFDNRKRSAEVALTNVGANPGTFRVSLIRLDMDADGACVQRPLERIPGQVALQDLIRFAPKEVTLGPQETQVVRLQVRKPADLPPGEYRLYLLASTLPPPPPEPGAGGAAPAEVRVNLTCLFGVAMPLLIRQGATAATVSIQALALDAEGKTLKFRLERTGNQSVYGDLKATFQPRSGRPQVLARANGLSVFTPNAFRNVGMALEGSAPGARLGQGCIRVEYSEPGNLGGALLTQGVLDVP